MALQAHWDSQEGTAQQVESGKAIAHQKLGIELMCDHFTLNNPFLQDTTAIVIAR